MLSNHFQRPSDESGFIALICTPASFVPHILNDNREACTKIVLVYAEWTAVLRGSKDRQHRLFGIPTVQCVTLQFTSHGSALHTPAKSQTADCNVLKMHSYAKTINPK